MQGAIIKSDRLYEPQRTAQGDYEATIMMLKFMVVVDLRHRSRV
jgi:hypothetical protein